MVIQGSLKREEGCSKAKQISPTNKVLVSHRNEINGGSVATLARWMRTPLAIDRDNLFGGN